MCGSSMSGHSCSICTRPAHTRRRTPLCLSVARLNMPCRYGSIAASMPAGIDCTIRFTQPRHSRRTSDTGDGNCATRRGISAVAALQPRSGIFRSTCMGWSSHILYSTSRTPSTSCPQFSAASVPSTSIMAFTSSGQAARPATPTTTLTMVPAVWRSTLLPLARHGSSWFRMYSLNSCGAAAYALRRLFFSSKPADCRTSRGEDSS
mmetsp:Transcript_20444/g.52361  ORF Transcript_20444/g.52361 Transcript_20444/m.52361 type:complete len:206 (-) Transcript_20444:640-1257(-)